MMAKSCCVEGCIAKDVVYFRFPNSRTQCKKWIEAINLQSKPSYNSVVCSDHFRPDDYGVVRGKVRLKPKVVPILQIVQKPNENIKNANKENTDSLDTQKNDCKEKDKEVKRRNSIKSINGGEKVDAIKDTKDSSDDDEPLSKHQTKNTLKNLSESINQVDLNANTSTEKDIEDILTYYSIKQNKNITEQKTEESQKEKSNDLVDLSEEVEPAPVFIEVAVNEEQNRGTDSPRDCLMLLESVQVELDPNELMMSDIEDGPCVAEDPISLVTSSDDDVVIEEPHIETVEVSDATDEDDVPLVRLAGPRPRTRAPNPFYRKDVWGTYQYFCPQCNYRTPSKAEYKAHTIQHATAVMVCRQCPYTTASKPRYTRHIKRHKDIRRYKCHLCDYKAKYQMSLVYHLKCHESVGDKCLFSDKL